MEFKAWPKTPRLYKDIVITEKIDGTNACITISSTSVGAQSRNRIITPDDDNYGFAAWVWKHSDELVEILGEGYHYGEWWGSSIQRGYGLTNGDKRFSLFNTHRWADVELSDIPGLGVVPKLYQGRMNEDAIEDIMRDLRSYGSAAAPGFVNPEGIIVYHTAIRQVFKVTLEGDEGKWKDID